MRRSSGNGRGGDTKGEKPKAGGLVCQFDGVSQRVLQILGGLSGLLLCLVPPRVVRSGFAERCISLSLKGSLAISRARARRKLRVASD